MPYGSPYGSPYGPPTLSPFVRPPGGIPLLPPKDVTATVDGSDIDITWTAASSVDGYNIYQSIDGGTWTKLNATTETGLTYTLTPTDPGEYNFYVTSVRGTKESAASAETTDYILLPTDAPLDESAALVSFYDSTNGDTWTTNTAWKNDNAIANWFGLTVGAGHVTEIALQNNNLSGIGSFNRYDFSGLENWYLNDSGALIDSFNDVATWNRVGGGSIAADTVNTRVGGQGIKITTDAGTNTEITKSFSAKPIDAQCTFQFYIHDITKINSILIYLFSSDGSYAFRTASLYSSGWHTAIENTNSFLGSLSNDINKIKIRIVPNAGEIAEVTMDAFYFGNENTPAIYMTFDDASPTVYTEAYAYMQANSLRGTFFVNTNQVDGASQISLAQLTTMYSAGWDIANHTTDHTDLTTLTQADAQTKLREAKTALDGWGFTRSSAYVAYPYGNWNTTVLAAMAAESMLTGRLVASSYAVCYNNTDQNYFIPAFNIESEGVVGFKARVDYCVANNTQAVFLAHVINTNPTIAEFQEMIDYAVSSGVKFLTMDDYYRSVI